MTLVGPGGVGKTRLSIEAAAAVADEFGTGCGSWSSPRSPNPTRWCTRWRRRCRCRRRRGRALLESIVDSLSGRRVLVVLDNCEHVIDAAAEIAAAVSAGAPKATILATSREPLGVAGEQVWKVSRARRRASRRSSCSVSVRGRPINGFEPSDDDLALIGRICERLDGMPLAIELAASRARSMSLAQLADRLADRFRLLRSSARGGVVERQADVAGDGGVVLPAPQLRRAGAVRPAERVRRQLRSRRRRGGVRVRPDRRAGRVRPPRLAGRQVAGARRPGHAAGTGCWRRCASTAPNSSTSGARSTSCGIGTSPTTSRSPSGRGSGSRAPATPRVGSCSRSSGTTCGPRSTGPRRPATSRPRIGWSATPFWYAFGVPRDEHDSWAHRRVGVARETDPEVLGRPRRWRCTPRRLRAGRAARPPAAIDAAPSTRSPGGCVRLARGHPGALVRRAARGGLRSAIWPRTRRPPTSSTIGSRRRLTVVVHPTVTFGPEAAPGEVAAGRAVADGLGNDTLDAFLAVHAGNAAYRRR